MKIRKQKVSPRQKMINLMYVILMAMLAMNVSSDVLNGFSMVDKSLSQSAANTSAQNDTLYKSFNDMYLKNPDKVGVWFERAKSVTEQSDKLCKFADKLKERIAKAADGSDGNYSNLKNREDLEASTFVMLSGSKYGKKLYDAINEYREFMMEMVETPEQKKMIANSLNTNEKNWEVYHFESMPAIAAITFLTKIQNDVRYVEGEVLHALAKRIDQDDVRVNELKAFVIPRSTSILQGEKFSAQVILAAVDSTQRPEISIDE